MPCLRHSLPHRYHASGDLRHRLLTWRAFGTVMLIVLLAPKIFAQSPATKLAVLDSIARVPVRNDFAIVAAKIHLGIDTANAYKQLDTLLSRAYGDMFWMCGCAGLYYATADVLRPQYKDRIRWAWKRLTPYRGDTENHFLMYYGSLLLMSQAWPDLADTDWFMGKSSKEIYKESKEYLDHWIQETARNGSTEWSSPRYGYYYITPLILLAEYTQDARLKHRFEMMLEYMLADYASNYLAGSYCGAHSRVGDDAAIEPRAAEINAYGQYFFEDSVTHVLPDLAFAAMSSFTCPKIIRSIATDRSRSYEQFSLKRGRQMIRYMDKWSASDSSHDSTFHAPVYKYEYMTKDYCLGSMQGGIVQPIQQQSWSLVFNSNKPHNIITGLHPYVSAEELGMFFPEYPSFQLERISNVKQGYTNENKWVGGSPYERIYQDKNVLVAMYDLPDSVKYHHVDLFIPTDAKILFNSTKSIHGARGNGTDTYFDSIKGCVCPYSYPQWECFRFDSTVIGIYMFSKYREYSSPEGLRLRMDSGKLGYLIVCFHLSELSSETFGDMKATKDNNLQAFAIVLAATPVQVKEDQIVSGNKIILHLNNQRNKNDYFFHSPFLESKKGSGILTMRYKGETRVLDFRE